VGVISNQGAVVRSVQSPLSIREWTLRLERGWALESVFPEELGTGRTGQFADLEIAA